MWLNLAWLYFSDRFYLCSLTCFYFVWVTFSDWNFFPYYMIYHFILLKSKSCEVVISNVLWNPRIWRFLIQLRSRLLGETKIVIQITVGMHSQKTCMLNTNYNKLSPTLKRRTINKIKPHNYYTIRQPARLYQNKILRLQV